MNKKKPLFDEREIQQQNQIAYYVARIIVVIVVCMFLFSLSWFYVYRAMEHVRIPDGDRLMITESILMPRPLPGTSWEFPEYMPVDAIKLRMEDELNAGPAIAVWHLYIGYAMAICGFICSTLLYRRVKLLQSIMISLASFLIMGAGTIVFLAVRYPAFTTADRFLFKPGETATYIWIFATGMLGLLIGIAFSEWRGYESFRILPMLGKGKKKAE